MRAGSEAEPAAANYNISSDVSKKDVKAKEKLVDYEPEDPTSLDLEADFGPYMPSYGSNDQESAVLTFPSVS